MKGYQHTLKLLIFGANSSRQLILIIEITNDLNKKLRGSKYSFEIDKDYKKIIEVCSKFLSKSGGSTIPKHMEKISLYYKIPIFTPSSKIELIRQNNKIYTDLQPVGEGSYASVFKYKDPFYEKSFILKRAKNDLNDKELQRFKREFDEMKKNVFTIYCRGV